MENIYQIFDPKRVFHAKKKTKSPSPTQNGGKSLNLRLLK